MEEVFVSAFNVAFVNKAAETSHQIKSGDKWLHLVSIIYCPEL